VIDGIPLATGVQLSRPANMDGFSSSRTFINYGFPLNALKSTLNLNGNASYSRAPGMINNITSYSKSSAAGLGFSLSSNISEKIDFLISSNINYNEVNNSIQNSNSHYYNVSSKVRLQVMPWKGIVVQSDISHQFNDGLSAGLNDDYFLWNAAIGYKFLKKQQAEIRLSVFDILKENKSITRNTTDLYYEDVESNALQQYFMLTLTYNLKRFTGSEESK
jgi:hypothetical protein